MSANQLLLIVAVAVAGYLFGPQINVRAPTLIGGFRGYTLHLDPNEVSPNVEDRRGDSGGGMERLDPPPQWQLGGRGGGELACWDNVEHRRVDITLCEQQGRATFR